MLHAAASLTFTADERAVLAGLAAQGFDVETCAEDGDEWAAIVPAGRVDPVASVQLTSEAGRRFVMIGADGRPTGRAGMDLGKLLARVKPGRAKH